MTKTYITSFGEVLISNIKGKREFLLMHDAEKTYKKIIDKQTVAKLESQGDWKIKQ